MTNHQDPWQQLADMNAQLAHLRAFYDDLLKTTGELLAEADKLQATDESTLPWAPVRDCN